MTRRTIELDDEQVLALERLAAQERRSVDELVRQAVSGYLAQHPRDWTDWNRRFDDLVARFRAGVPPDVTPEEIEADITAAREEYRAGVRAELAARRAARGPDATDAGRR